MQFSWKACSREMCLTELQKENAPVLNAELLSFEQALGGNHTPFLPDVPDFSFTEKGTAESADALLCRFSNAIDGMLAGEAAAKNSAPIRLRALTQADYIQLPLLTLEAYRHGIGIPEMLDGWDSWIADATAPEKILCTAVKDGCPIEKLGAFQAFSSYASDMRIVQRAMCWALPYACQPQKAAQFACLDAYTSTRGSMLIAAALFAAAISCAFRMPPQEAVRTAIYGMPSDFAKCCDPNRCADPAAFENLIEQQCSIFLHTIQTSHSAEECFERLSSLRADPCCFIAAGAVYGAASFHPADPEADCIPTRLAYSESVSKEELSLRLLQITSPILFRQNAPWED